MTVTKRKGIIVAGGSGTRLYPLTLGVSKQMLPFFDKPMIFNPLSVLMPAGMCEVLIRSKLGDLPTFRKLLGNDSIYGIEVSYAVQPSPNGLAQAFITGEGFIGDDACHLILRGNIFYGHHISENLSAAKSSYAATGMFFYDSRIVEFAKRTKPSESGELEITGVNRDSLEDGTLTVEMLGRGFAWLDTGIRESLLEASHIVHTIEHRQGLKVACLEEIAFDNEWINMNQLHVKADKLIKTDYGMCSAKVSDEAAAR